LIYYKPSLFHESLKIIYSDSEMSIVKAITSASFPPRCQRWYACYFTDL